MRSAGDAADGGTAGHEAVLYFRPLADRDTEEFFGDSRYGEFWVGARPTLADIESELGLTARHIDEFGEAVGKDAGEVTIRVVRDADRRGRRPASTRPAPPRPRRRRRPRPRPASTASGRPTSSSPPSSRSFASSRTSGRSSRCATPSPAPTRASTPSSPTCPRRSVAGAASAGSRAIFGLHARHHGNGVGYDSICASGDHANTLHWIKNTGDIKDGDLLLLDAGVEVDSLFTADITRTLPVSGTFTEAQRRIYDAVYAAQEAGIAACKPGNKFSDVHAAAIRVIAEHLHEWGLLPEGVDVEGTLDPDHGQYHRRWMVHGTSHHLGIDVHDCALATREEYSDAELKPGMILTVEPGLYFKADDELVPVEFRGNGVRIEDDILITDDGCENLSAAMPRSADEVEQWIAGIWAARP